MPRRYRVLAAVAGGLLLFYTIAGFLIIPAVARSQAISTLNETFGVDLAIGKLRFNPYTLVARIDDVTLHASDGERLVAFRHLVVNLQWRSLIERAIVFRSIELTEPFIHVHLREDGTLNLVAAFTGGDAGTQAPESSPEPTGEPSPPLAVVIEAFMLANGELRLTDDQNSRGFDQHFTPLNLQLRAFTTRPEYTSELTSLLISIAQGGQIALSGSLSAVPAGFDIRLVASDLPLSRLQPYVPETLAAKIAEGRLSFDLSARHGQPGQATLMSLQGAAAITGFTVEVSGRDEPVLAWHEVALRDIALDLQPDRLVIKEIVIQGLDSSFRIYDDGDTNVGKVLRSASTGDEESAPDAAVEPGDTADAFPFTIERIVVDGSTLMFSDEQIQPPITVRIDELGGEFTGLDSAPESRLTTRIEGTVGGHGRADISGVAALFAPDADLDAKISFANIEMTDFSPYSGKFAGYEILKGKLFLDLQYTLAGTRIKGENRALLDQFELGKRVDSEDATSLPVKFALSLLRDRQGRIDISLPVEGDVNDPGFRFGHLITQALINMLTKIVTSPFSFIAGLFGGGPEMEYAQFDAGSAGLSAAERNKFAPLSTALAERPQLIVEIQGWSDPVNDDSALRQHKIDALLAAWPTLEAAYDAHFDAGAAAALRDELAAAETKGSDHQTDIPETDPALLFEREMHQRLLAGQVVTDEELITLAYARGEQVMDSLVRNGGVEAERIFVRRGEIGRTGEGTRAQLILDAR